MLSHLCLQRMRRPHQQFQTIALQWQCVDVTKLRFCKFKRKFHFFLLRLMLSFNVRLSPVKMWQRVCELVGALSPVGPRDGTSTRPPGRPTGRLICREGATQQEVNDMNAMVHALQTVHTNHASHEHIIQSKVIVHHLGTLSLFCIK